QHEPGLAGEGEECGQAECLLALASPPGDREPVEPRIACQGERRPDPRGISAVVGPRIGIVRRPDVATPGPGQATRIVEAEEPLLRHLEARVVPVAPATGGSGGRA